MPFSRSEGTGAGVSPASDAIVAASAAASVVAAVGIADASVADGVAAVAIASCVVAAVGVADTSVADGVAAVAVAACVVAAVGVAAASGVFVIVSTVVFADCGGISPLSVSMRRMRWRIWRPSQRNSTTSPGCSAAQPADVGGGVVDIAALAGGGSVPLFGCWELLLAGYALFL